jgi:hypothetical protein
MAFMISIEDLVANALIQNLTINEDKRFLTYSEIESYGAKVVKILIDENEEAVLLLSRLKTNQMLHDYSEFFEEKIVDNQLGIELKESKTVDDLSDEFRSYLSLKLLSAFIRGYKEVIN